MPICSLAAAMVRSLEAMSGRRSSSCDGSVPEMAGIVARATVIGSGGRVNAAGALPIRTAIACS